MTMEFVFYELLWILPLLAGILANAHMVYSFSRRDALSLVLRCFILSVVVLLLGALCTWRAGLSIWITAGVAGYISTDLLYGGWKQSWWPLSISGVATILLLGIAILSYKRRTQSPSLTPMRLHNALAIPAGGVLILVLIGFLVEVITEPFMYPYLVMPWNAWVIRLMALGAIGYFTLAFFGIPYSILWGVSLRRWKVQNPGSKFNKALLGFFMFFTLAAVSFTALFLTSAMLGENPYFYLISRY